MVCLRLGHVEFLPLPFAPAGGSKPLGLQLPQLPQLCNWNTSRELSRPDSIDKDYNTCPTRKTRFRYVEKLTTNVWKGYHNVAQGGPTFERLCRPASDRTVVLPASECGDVEGGSETYRASCPLVTPCHSLPPRASLTCTSFTPRPDNLTTMNVTDLAGLNCPAYQAFLCRNVAC